MAKSGKIENIFDHGIRMHEYIQVAYFRLQYSKRCLDSWNNLDERFLDYPIRI
jgi:hypothetical protein